MSRPVADTRAVRQVRDALGALVDWHDARPRARWGSLRGLVWTALIAATFVWMSNPLVFVPSFYLSLGMAIVWTKVAVIVTLPWLRLPRVPWPWLLFLLLAWASQWWTISEPNTHLSLVVYTELTVLAVMVAANCEPLVVCWGLGLGGVATVALSVYAYEQELPGASYAALEGVIFTGIGTNQNILAYTMAVSLAAVLAIGWPRRAINRTLWLGVLGVDLYGVHLANSSNGYLTALSLLVAAALVALWPRVRARGRGHTWGVAAGAGALLLLAAVVVVTALGDQFSTFSGRAPLWRAAIESTMSTAPVLGSGWGAVWEHPWDSAAPNDVAADIYARAGLVLSHGHNLLVDVLPELGLVGVAAALLMLVVTIRQAVVSGVGTAPHHATGRLVLFTVVALVVFGITEPMLTVPLGWWALTLVMTSARQRDVAGRGGHRGWPGRRAARHDTSRSDEGREPGSAESGSNVMAR